MRIVCGLDVHKDSVFACILNENGDKFECKFGVLTPELEELHQLLLAHDVKEVTMESTSIYWHPIWRVLDDIEDLKLVNPYFIKQLPGRKSDVRDAAWIAECTMKDLIRGSFVPSTLVQRMRQYNRRIFDLNKEIVYKLTKLDSVLQRCNIRISNYVSSVDSKSYKDVVRLISEGVTVPRQLATVIHGRTINRVGKETISAGKIKSRRITHGNKYIRKTMVECAWGASKTPNCFFSKFSYTQTVVRKKNAMKVKVAIARKMLIAIWHVLSEGKPYTDYKKPDTKGNS